MDCFLKGVIMYVYELIFVYGGIESISKGLFINMKLLNKKKKTLLKNPYYQSHIKGMCEFQTKRRKVKGT